MTRDPLVIIVVIIVIIIMMIVGIHYVYYDVMLVGVGVVPVTTRTILSDCRDLML